MPSKVHCAAGGRIISDARTEPALRGLFVTMQASGSGNKEITVGDQDALNYKVSIGKAIPIGALFVAGTFMLVSYMNLAEVEALKAQRDAALGRPADQPVSIPRPTDATTGKPQVVAELSAQIEALEQEKKVLVSRMTDLSRDALDPSSELGGLVRQLESDSQDARLDAVTGLLTLNDARAVQPLIDYYWRDPTEATRRILATRYMYYSKNLKPEVGADFIIRILQSDQPQHAEFAFSVIGDHVLEDEFDTLFAPRLEDVALRSDDTLVRTRAKVLLRNRAGYLDRQKEYEDDAK